jgi:hypothetical protein
MRTLLKTDKFDVVSVQISINEETVMMNAYWYYRYSSINDQELIDYCYKYNIRIERMFPAFVNVVRRVSGLKYPKKFVQICIEHEWIERIFKTTKGVEYFYLTDCGLNYCNQTFKIMETIQH